MSETDRRWMKRFLCQVVLDAVTKRGADRGLTALDWTTRYGSSIHLTGQLDGNEPALQAWADLLTLRQGYPDQGSVLWAASFSGVRIAVWGITDRVRWAQHLPAELPRGAPRAVRPERPQR